MKPINKFIIAKALLVFCFAVQSHAQDQRPLVLSTVSMINDMAMNIGGDNFRYASICPIGSDPHLYDPVPGDARKCVEASLIFLNGLTFEGWLQKLIENSGTTATSKLVTEGIVPIQSLKYENASDPHAWMTAANGLIYAQNIRDAMIELMPDQADEFTENYDAYKMELEELDRYISRRISSIPEEKRILITSHDAFQYFGRRYGIRLEAILGTSTDADVQTSDISRLTRVIQSTAVPAVFIESTINPRLIGQIAADNGIVVGGKLFADSLGETDGPAGTYLKMLRHNADVIYDGLMLKRGDGTSSSSGDAGDFSWLWAILLAPVALAAAIFIYRVVK